MLFIGSLYKIATKILSLQMHIIMFRSPNRSAWEVSTWL